MSNTGYVFQRFPPMGRATSYLLEAASRQHMIHAILEVSVPRDLIRQHGAKVGQALSFTSYLIHCLARAVDGNRHMHAYGDWRNRLILFENVDISTPVEQTLGDGHQ